MVKVAFFGHNSNEYAVQKRARSFKLAGIDVVGVMPQRGDANSAQFDLISLGRTKDNDYAGRLGPLWKSITLKAKGDPKLSDINLIYARNLDMLACAFSFRFRNRLKAPIVYECLDIHNLMIGSGLVSAALRKLEGMLLKRSNLMVYSSEQYLESYFDVRQPGKYRTRLVENRMNASELGPRPIPETRTRTGPFKIGWIGNLRCRKSLTLLKSIGEKFGDKLQIEIHGYPALGVFPDFEAEVANAPGIHYHGRYDSVNDLPNIYRGLDVVWAADWYEADHNSVWQIPNRIYEGGYFGVPAITTEGTATSAKVAQWGSGWTLSNPPEKSAQDLIAKLLDDPEEVNAKSRVLLNLALSTFVETPEETQALINDALR